MSDSSLALSFDDLRSAVGRELGFGSSASGWCESDALLIDRDVASGLRTFYFPPVLPGETKMHEWSFFRPIGSVVTAAGVGDYDLPDDYGGLCGELSFSDADGAMRPIILTGEGRIRTLRQREDAGVAIIGYPEFAAVRPKAHDGTEHQRWQIQFWPEPSASYTVMLPYNVIPAGLTAAQKFPYGGAQHSETLLAACLAAMERRDKGTEGVHHAAFYRLLQSSISLDRSAFGPAILGYNADRSQPTTFGSRRVLQPVTYNGVVYDGL